MSWKKHFRVPPSKQGEKPAYTAETNASDVGSAGTSSKHSSYLPEVYAGQPNRVMRYYQYDEMDRDSDIHLALNTIANFCTQSELQTDEPFQIKYSDEANETEQKLLKKCLNKWNKVNSFRTRLWHIFRDATKNGDAFFLRDPETGEWLWLDHYSVILVTVDEDKGKEPDQYVIRGLDYNRAAKFASTKVDTSIQNGPLATAQSYTSRPGGMGSASASSSFQMTGSHVDPRAPKPGQTKPVQDETIVDADHIIHLSMSAGLDVNWPFGPSILEPVFKVFKQKELLEDAIIIYRIQRAPERRVFYIDVGDMNPIRAKAHIQSIKNEIHQKRIPNHNGGGNSIVDAAYNPLSIQDDLYFAQTAEGRGSKVEVLEGGDNLGEIGDLDFFTRKFARGMGIPFSYLAISEEKNGATYNDGKLGSAMVEEFQFNKFCMRLQNMLAPVFDKEFKRFIRDDGFEIDEDIFELQFNPPQNFSKYRDIEVRAAHAGLYGQVADNKKLSERFKFKYFLGLTEEEMLENETWWKEENAAKVKKVAGSTPAETDPDTGLSSVGLRGGGGFGDMPMPGDDMGELGDLGDDAGGDDLGGDGGDGGDAPAAPEGGNPLA
jgi:hypothetical protein